MSKLAIEICLVFVDLWTQTTPNLRDQKWTVRPCLFNTLDATWNKLHLKRFLQVNIENLLDNCLILLDKMLTRFFSNSIDANTLWYAFWTGSARYGEDIRSALFGFGQNFKKGTAFVIPFSENYHMWISRNFCGVAAIEIPAFSIFKKGAYLSASFSSRSSVLGGRLFSFS